MLIFGGGLLLFGGIAVGALLGALLCMTLVIIAAVIAATYLRRYAQKYFNGGFPGGSGNILIGDPKAIFGDQIKKAIKEAKEKGSSVALDKLEELDRKMMSGNKRIITGMDANTEKITQFEVVDGFDSTLEDYVTKHGGYVVVDA